MSTRQPPLPPRCPFQRKPVSRPIQDLDSRSVPTNSFHTADFKPPSQGSTLEDQPAWLDDLLSDQEVSTKGATRRRSASDSLVLLDGLGDSLSSLHLGDRVNRNDVKNEGSGMLELDCIYGPNSPRGGSSGSTFSDRGIISAFSHYISHNPLQLLDGSLCISGTTRSDLKGDAPSGGANEEFNPEMKQGKRSESTLFTLRGPFSSCCSHLLMVAFLLDHSYVSYYMIYSSQSMLYGPFCDKDE